MKLKWAISKTITSYPSFQNPSRLSNEREGKVREKRGDLIMGEDGALLTPEQLDAQDEPLRSTLINGPLSQTITEVAFFFIHFNLIEYSKPNENSHLDLSLNM